MVALTPRPVVVPLGYGARALLFNPCSRRVPALKIVARLGVLARGLPLDGLDVPRCFHRPGAIYEAIRSFGSFCSPDRPCLVAA